MVAQGSRNSSNQVRSDEGQWQREKNRVGENTTLEFQRVGHPLRFTSLLRSEGPCNKMKSARRSKCSANVHCAGREVSSGHPTEVGQRSRTRRAGPAPTPHALFFHVPWYLAPPSPPASLALHCPQHLCLQPVVNVVAGFSAGEWGQGSSKMAAPRRR